MRRFTRLRNGFTKIAEKLPYAISLHYIYDNFCKIHSTIKCTPAMRSGVVYELWDITGIVRIIEIWERATRQTDATRERELEYGRLWLMGTIYLLRSIGSPRPSSPARSRHF
jgi:hypothetical protein